MNLAILAAGVFAVVCAAASAATAQETPDIRQARWGAPGGWANVTDKLRDDCKGKTQCVAHARISDLGDPKPGTEKRLTAIWACGSRIMHGGNVAEGDALVVNCAAAQPGSPTMVIRDAHWGRRDLKKELGDLCNGKTVCDVPASTAFWDDQDRGQVKELHITFQCGSAENYVKAAEGGVARAKC